MSVLVVGSVALDTVKTAHGEAVDVLGGSASYFSVAARHFVPVELVAVVGEDFPHAHREFLERAGVGMSGLQVLPGRTFRWAGEYSADFCSRRTLDTQLNVFADFRPELPAAQRAASHLFLANIHPELQGRVLDQVTSPRLVVMDTMNYWIDRARRELLETVRRVDVLLLNDEETRMLSGESNLIRAARAVLEMGPRVVIVKKGEHGALVMTRAFAFSVPAYPIEGVFDPTGAGDTFAGGFLGHLAGLPSAGDEDLRRAAVYGTVLASFAVESFGLDRMARATREEIDTRYRDLHHMSRF